MEGRLTTFYKPLIACGRRAFLVSFFFFVMATSGVDAM